ncbi:exodeoxyribonuclease VII [Alkalispirochaeta sphaeroplastigenens]|uniref:Exodeoxyribonuclease 7 small subunit n=1 Tax=Alkalispirochaeta sphaeroplastigenens TaxID=1187066 RepID=A0A2S4JFK4_9SPIO|nr:MULTISPECIES: exodeoxyribonuclease VII small subunit [Alkalispirochaeta]POQ98200.1 exodeoxyribonuclease VII [Alkalispirochaeta sphaeroplastigenens]
MKTFEKRLERLEEIAEKLRDGTTPIDQASTLFEEGLTLARSLEGELQKLERRIQVLVNKPESSDDPQPPVLELFPELEARAARDREEPGES